MDQILKIWRGYRWQIVLAALVLGLLVYLYISKKGPFAIKFIWPAPGPITSPFGMRFHPVDLVNKMHNGIDIDGETGDPVYASAAGVVDAVYETEGGGNSLRLRHANGYTTMYLHLDTRMVEEGQRVRKGEQIAKMGATGRVTGPHLHFSMKDDEGEYIDPSTVITA